MTTRTKLRHYRHLAWLLACALGHAWATQAPLLGAQQIAAGFLHTCAVVNGAVQCWGDNASLQLGIAGIGASSEPLQLPGLTTGASGISAGFFHSCAVVNGGARCWGDNASGELGNGTTKSTASPVAVTGLNSGVTVVVTSGGGGAYPNLSHSCAIVNGGAQCWGDNTYGELGDGTVNPSATPVPVTGLSSGVTAITAGEYHTCAIVNAAAVCWGSNYYQQLGTGNTTDSHAPVAVTGLGSGVTAIAAGYDRTCAIVNGAAQCWGSSFYGELGGATSDGNPGNVTGLNSGVLAISSGDWHTCVVVSNDATHPVKCWGLNSSGQLGDTSAINSSSPVNVSLVSLAPGDSVNAIAAGGHQTCALVTRSTITKLQCWGDNEFGELGLGGLPIENPVPSTVSGLTSNVSTISTGSSASHNCAVVGGAARCWGANGGGQLGSGSLVDSSLPQPVSTLSSGVSSVTTGSQHSCAIVNGSAQCWGTGIYGALGSANTSSVSPVVVTGLTSGVTKITAGSAHTCAIVSGGAQCWGYNHQGQLGNGSTMDSSTPVAVQGLASGVTAIAAGDFYTCAVVNGGVVCWGDDFLGELGNGTMSSTPVTVPVAVTGLDSGATAVAAGGTHTCAIVNGGAQCWGDNYSGDVGNGTTSHFKTTPVAVTGLSSGVTGIVAGAFHTCAIVSGGVQCWGDNNEGELGYGAVTVGAVHSLPIPIPTLSSGVISIGATATNTCALLSSGAEQCWGDDRQGQSGDARFLSAETPQFVARGNEIFFNSFDAD